MTYFQAYLFSILDSINTASHIAFAICLVITMITTVVAIAAYYDTSRYSLTEDEYQKKLSDSFLKKIMILNIKKIVAFNLLLALLAIAIPTQKQLAFIYITPKIINNENLQESIKKLPKLTNLGLDYLNDILEKKTE